MSKLSKLRMERIMGFALNTGEYGVATESEIAEMCVNGSKVYKQSIATYEEIEWANCSGGDLIKEGTYLIEGGFLEVELTGEDEDYESHFLPFVTFGLQSA